MTVLGLVSIARPPRAQAAGTPNLSIAVNGPADALIQAPATPMTYAATVTNPAPNPNGFNLGYKVTLPPGVTFVSSTAGSPTTTTTLPNRTTVLYFENIADILTNSSNAFSIDVTASDPRYPVNSSVAVRIDAYASSDPRQAPTMAPGTTTVTGSTGSAGATSTATIKALKLVKSEPSPEGELPRGVHDHPTVYTLAVTTNGVSPNSLVVVEDYLPAGMEFLGCGTWDNTTNAATSGTAVEYAGASRLDATTPDLPLAALPVGSGTTTGCRVPDRVETVSVDPDGAGPAPLGVYTHLVWTIGTMPAGAVLNLEYAAGVPMRQNTMTWPGATPAAVCTATSCSQAANLDNNSGPETTDEQVLINAASARGTYTGIVAAGTGRAVSDATTKTVTAEDLALQKSVAPTAIARGGLSTWTLNFQTGEYRSVGGDLFVTDTLPDGLCPLGSTNFEPVPQKAECNPVAGVGPMISVAGGPPTPTSYASRPVENPDGTWTLTFAVPAGMPPDSTLSITFPTRTREYYQENFTDAEPVLANDSWENTVAAASTATGVISGTNVSGAPRPAPDDSSAGQTSANPDIEKFVAVPQPNTQLSCNASTVTYQPADDLASAVQYYRPGDRICYRVRVTLNGGEANPTVGSGLYYRNIDVTDYLPPGFTFERYWGVNAATGQTGADLIHTVVADPPSAGSPGTLLAWHLGSPAGGALRFVDASIERVFEVEFSALVPPPAGIPGGTLLQSANLSKATTVNSAGVATSLRNQALGTVTRPSLSLDKSRSPSAAVVAPATPITYSLAVTNHAPLPDPQGFGGAVDITVRDLLPFEVRCSAVSAISAPPGGAVGVCSDPSPDTPGARSRVDWTVPGPLLPQQTQRLSYVLTLPPDLAPSEDLVNDAGVRTYAGPVNTGGTPTVYIPPNNIDPALTPNIVEPARDQETVQLAPVVVDKLQRSELAESGNSRNPELSATIDQATVGEYVDYVVRMTLPASSTVYEATATDTLPAGLSLLTSGPNGVVPSAFLDGAVLPSSWTFDASTLTVTLPTPYAVDKTPDTIEVRFRAIVTDTAANASGMTKVNSAAFTYKTKAAETGVEPTQIRNPGNSTTLQIVEPNLSMTKDDDDADSLVVPGQQVTYTLTATNTGSAAHDVVTTDCVPEHLTVVTPVPPPATPAGVAVSTATNVGGCTGTLITWTFPSSFSLDQGAPVALTYSVTVDAPTTAGQTFVNTARTTATSYPGANPDERTTYEASAADQLHTILPTVAKSVDPADATVGSTLTYTVIVTVPGGLAAPDATVLDVLPPGLDFEALTAVACTGAPGGFTCPSPSTVPVLPSGGPSPATGGVLGFFLDDLPASPPGQPWTIALTYRSTVANGAALVAGSTLVNTADLRWNPTSRYDANTLPNPDPAAFALDSADATATVTLHEPKVVVDKDVTYSAPTNAPCDQNHAASTGATDVDACQIAPDAAPTTMMYHLSVTNTGDWPAYDVVVTDSADLPAPSQIASLTITDPAGAVVTDGSITDGTGLSFRYPGPLAPGASFTITYTVELTTSDLNHDGNQVLNTMTVPSFSGISAEDRAAYPDREYRTYVGPSDTDTVTLRYPKPTISKSAVSDATDARIGQPFTWSITVGNASDFATLFGADVTDVLPAGWRYEPGSTTVTSAAGVTPNPLILGDPLVAPPADGHGPTLTWTDVATLDPQGTFTIHFQAVPTDELATVATTGAFPHVNTASIAGADGSGAPGNADGPYAASAQAQALIRRADLELQKAVTTAGPYSFGQTIQYTVTVTDTGPDPATGVSVLEKLPASLIFRSVVSSSVGNYDPATGVWAVGSLAVGSPQTLVLSVQINATGEVVNDSQVQSSDQWDPDSTPGNQQGPPAEDDESRVRIVTEPTRLGDRVWFDIDKDGVQDPTEPGIAGVTVTLADPGPDGVFGTADDGPTQRTVTDSSGSYQFTGLAVERAYLVTVDHATLPGGMTETFDIDGLGTPDAATVTIPLAAGPAGRSDVDFGYVGTGSIGDLVWFDRDGSGTPTQDPGEPGLPGIHVTITWAGADGVLGTPDDVAFPTTTDATGAYLVADLPFGPYAVTVDTSSPAFPAGVVPTYDADGTGTPNTSTVTLTTAAPTVRDQDFSYTGTASIGDRVWLDQNGDGVQDPSEHGIPGVTVTVTYLGADGVPGGGDDIVFTTTTGADGAYLVDKLPAGAYTVAVDPSTLPGGVAPTADLDGIGTPNTTAVTLATAQARRDVDFGYTGPGSIGDQVWLDTAATGDATFDPGTDRPLAGVAITVTYLGPDGAPGGGDDIVFTTTTDATGTYTVTGLPLGAYTVAASPPVTLTPTYDADGLATPNLSAVTLTAEAPVNADQDFSYTGAGSIGDLVWHDRNGDGQVQPGEEGIPGVTVTATWAGPDGVFGTPDDIVLPPVTTGADGSYVISNLPPGEFRVDLDPATIPVGYVPTYDLDGGPPRSATVTLEVGQHRTDVDFGEREIADLMVVKSHPAGEIGAGDQVIFRITVTNLGPGTGHDVQFVDTLPAGMTLVSALGEGWNCTPQGQNVTCVLDGDLASWAEAYVDLTVTTGVAAAPGVTNTVTVSSSTPDPNQANNTSVDPVVVSAADLSVAKSLVGALVSGSKAEYVLAVVNHGPSGVPVGKVVVLDQVPAQLSVGEVTSAEFSCAVTGQNVVCTNRGDFPAGATATISIRVTAASVSSTVQVTNTAAVTGGFVDPDAANNRSSVTSALADLPKTGFEAGALIFLAVVAMAIGGALVLFSRRRRMNPE
ncbi:MAG: SdrD B-like domain-containing protein [Dermatophilaceae bacterium]